MSVAVKSHEAAKLVVTARGYARLRADLDRLTGEDRRAVRVRLRDARDDGDVSVNPALLDALDEHEQLEHRIAVLEHQLQAAEIAAAPTDGGASIGTRVRIRELADDAVHEFELVSEPEADVTNGLLSVEAPVGAALLGQQPGAVVEVKTPGGGVLLEIVGVETSGCEATGR